MTIDTTLTNARQVGTRLFHRSSQHQRKFKARHGLANQFAGIALKQTFAHEGKQLKRRAGGYAHAKQFKRLRRVTKRQRTVLGIVLREVGRKLATTTTESPTTLNRLNTLFGRAERTQRSEIAKSGATMPNT